MSVLKVPTAELEIVGQRYILTFDMAAALEMKESFGIELEQLQAFFGRKLKPGEMIDITPKLLYACTRSMDVPPTMKEIKRLPIEAISLVWEALLRMAGIAIDPGALGKANAGTAKAQGSRRSGTGASRSRRAARTSGSRRARS